MGLLANRLLILLNEYPADSVFYHIALTMLFNCPRLESMGITEIAALCSVSKSTISKFVRELGYDDYASFRYAARFEDVRYRPQHTFVSDVLGYLDSHSYAEYAEELVRSIRATVRTLDEAAIDRLVQDIAAAAQVAAFGLMFSETAALDLQTKLSRCGKFIMSTPDDRAQFRYIRKAGRDDLIIVFSDAGTYMDRYEMIDRDTGKSVYALTDARVVMITANRKMAADSRLAYIVPYESGEELRTHRVVYPLLTDIICHRYYRLHGGAAALSPL